MRKNVFAFHYLAIVFIVVVVIFPFGNLFSIDNLSLDKIKTKARLIYSNASKNIISLSIKSNIYNGEGELIMSKEMLMRSPNKLRINVEDFLERQTYIFISNKEGFWFNKPFFPLEAFLTQMISILAGESSKGRILEEESEIQKVGNRDCLIISFLFFNGLKIKGYLEPQSFTWLKTEVFTLNQGNWVRMLEIYSQKIEDVKGIKIDRHPLIYLYSPEGKQIRQEVRVYSVKTNIDIDNSIFEIPPRN